MQKPDSGSQASTSATRDRLSVTDRRTGREYQLEIKDATIRALDLRQIKVEADEFGTMAFDPGFGNTASCRSAITFIDGEKGILNYRGYPIEQIAEQACQTEIAWLLLEGELPDAEELERFRAEVRAAGTAPEGLVRLFGALRPDMHPMKMLVGALAVLGAEFPESSTVGDPVLRRRQIVRLFALAPVVAAMARRHRKGLAFVEPDPQLSYAGNFLRLMFGEPGRPYRPEPAFERALNTLLVLHADHEQNCSTNAMRSVGSSLVDPYTAASAACSALYGPLHGGANQKVLEMLDEIGDVAAVPAFIDSCKSGKRRLMGFGHRVYKSYDPRATIIKKMSDEVFAITGASPKLAIAMELERIALEDGYFVERKLYPNVDFYSGLIYDALGFDTAMFTVFFAVGRMPGWLAHWDEMQRDPELRIARPRQIYTGPERRDYVPLGQR